MKNGRFNILFLMIMFSILLSFPALASTDTVKVGSKQYIIKTDYADCTAEVYVKTSSGNKLLAKADDISEYKGHYKDVFYFSDEDYYPNTYAYKVGKKNFEKKQSKLVIVDIIGRYALARKINGEGLSNQTYSYDLKTNKKKLLSVNSFEAKVIDGKIYYTKANVSSSTISVIRCNMNGTGAKVIKTLTAANGITKMVAPPSEYKYAVNFKNGMYLNIRLFKDHLTLYANGKNTKVYYKNYKKQAAIKLNKTSSTLTQGKTLQLKAIVTGSSKKVTWSSSNKKIATVASSGMVTAKAAGSAVITAKANGKTAKCKVTVKKASGWKSAYNKILSNWKLIDSLGETSSLRYYFGNGYKFNRYFIYDIDGNGIPELFFSSTTMTITYVLTYKNGKVVALGYNSFSGINRSKHILIVHGHWHGAGGSATSEYHGYKISGNSLKRVFYIDHMPMYYVVDNGDEQYQHYSSSAEYNKFYAKYVKGITSISSIKKYPLSKKL